MNINKTKLMIYLFLILLSIFIAKELIDDFFTKGTKVENNQIIQMIKNSNIEKITHEEPGNKLLNQNRIKIRAYTRNKEIFWTKMDFTFYSGMISLLIERPSIKFEPVYFYNFNFLRFLFDIIHIFSSSVFIFYIINNIKKTSNKLNSNPLISSKQKSRFTFKDVAGNEEEKEEMKELIDFLKRPQKYVAVGAKIPKGILLEGPPGTGKTLLAKALAGEVGVPFYAVSGSEFVEMFVGVGASRVRKLFKEAKNNAPCVLFIDEIDVLGGKRSGFSGGPQETDQTLNQLLTEMDGFSQYQGIIIIGATNRADMLDSALLRPGRFDRIFKVGLPDVKSRESILKLHARNKKVAPEINFHQLAKQTPGMSGAQLEAVLNEASILTVRNQKEMITMEELEEAIDRVLMGPAKKSIKYTEEERKMVAYHEAGHAVIGLKLEHAQKFKK
ncbi:AAA family ATPase [Candidatus Phytoplasma ziziphi]|uniref:AAA family ATPase n=1 Tax=Ziziphus jujuba witches'-broom phytoplasma TaxID=135727 RepID=UPI001EDE7C0E|nr:AAA family ATPase [Candidatus Phytoplasma ziziphi]